MTFRYSASQVLKLFLICSLGAAVCGVYVLYVADNIINIPVLVGAGWVAFVLFSIVALLMLAVSFRKGVGVEFTDEGILNARNKWPLVRWDQIERITLTQVGIAPMFLIHPKPNFPSSIRRDPGGMVSFSVFGLNPGMTEAADWIRQNRPGLLD